MKYPQFFFDFTYRIAGPQAQTATQKKSKEFLGYVQEVFDIMTANGSGKRCVGATVLIPTSLVSCETVNPIPAFQ